RRGTDAFVGHDARARFELPTFDHFSAIGEDSIDDAGAVPNTRVRANDTPLHGGAFADTRFLPDHARCDRRTSADDRLVADHGRAGDGDARADVRAPADVNAAADLRACRHLRAVEAHTVLATIRAVSG